MDPDEKAGAVIGGLKGGQHLEEIIERRVLARNDTAGPLGSRELREHLRHIIGHLAVADIRAEEHMANQNVKVKTGGNPKATAPLQEGLEEGIVIQDEVPGIFVRQQFDQTIGGLNLLAENRKDEINILGRKLDAAVWLNHLHCFILQLFDESPDPAIRRDPQTSPKFSPSKDTAFSIPPIGLGPGLICYVP